MFSDSLYRDVVLDHAKNPRNYGDLPAGEAGASARKNPSCGDEVKIYVHVNGNNYIDVVRFEGVGCAISQASASMLTEVITGKTPDEAKAVANQMRAMMTTDDVDPDDLPGDLFALSGVKQFPARVRCAMLAWHVLEDVLNNEGPGPQITVNS